MTMEQGASTDGTIHVSTKHRRRQVVAALCLPLALVVIFVPIIFIETPQTGHAIFSDPSAFIVFVIFIGGLGCFPMWLWLRSLRQSFTVDERGFTVSGVRGGDRTFRWSEVSRVDGFANGRALHLWAGGRRYVWGIGHTGFEAARDLAMRKAHELGLKIKER